MAAALKEANGVVVVPGRGDDDSVGEEVRLRGCRDDDVVHVERGEAFGADALFARRR